MNGSYKVHNAPEIFSNPFYNGTNAALKTLKESQLKEIPSGSFTKKFSLRNSETEMMFVMVGLIGMMAVSLFFQKKSYKRIRVRARHRNLPQYPQK